MSCCTGNTAPPGTGTLGGVPAWGVSPQDWAPLFPFGSGAGSPAATPSTGLPWWIWIVLAAIAGYVLRGSEARA